MSSAVGGLEGLLEPGEALLWSDRPSYPRGLRRLGLPPRRPAHLVSSALLLTLVSGLLLAAARLDLEPDLRWGLALAGGLPALGLGGLALWAARRHRRERYALTDRGRVLIQRGGALQALDLPAEAGLRSDPEGAFGSLYLGPAAPLLPDLPYPATLQPILSACRAGLSARPGGAPAGG